MVVLLLLLGLYSCTVLSIFSLQFTLHMASSPCPPPRSLSTTTTTISNQIAIILLYKWHKYINFLLWFGRILVQYLAPEDSPTPLCWIQKLLLDASLMFNCSELYNEVNGFPVNVNYSHLFFFFFRRLFTYYSSW